MRLLILIFTSLFLQQNLYAVSIQIESPAGGFTTEAVQTIRGTINGFTGKQATLIINGIPQGMPVNNGRFSLNTVAAPGNNLIEVQAGGVKKSVSFFAKVPPKDIKVVLTWDTATDVDLWVIDPKGEKCYYGNAATSSGGNLDIDIVAGYGPETFTMANAIPGEYSVQAQYYASRGAPISRVTVYVILNEGTPQEQRRDYQFPMTKGYQVYHITNFVIEK